jgi:hypothetical protein
VIVPLATSTGHSDCVQSAGCSKLAIGDIDRLSKSDFLEQAPHIVLQVVAVVEQLGSDKLVGEQGEHLALMPEEGPDGEEADCGHEEGEEEVGEDCKGEAAGLNVAFGLEDELLKGHTAGHAT